MNQSRVPVPPQQPPNPRDYPCEWCGSESTATRYHERKVGAKRLGTQQYIFTCSKHHHLGEQAVSYKPRQRTSI